VLMSKRKRPLAASGSRGSPATARGNTLIVLSDSDEDDCVVISSRAATVQPEVAPPHRSERRQKQRRRAGGAGGPIVMDLTSSSPTVLGDTSSRVARQQPEPAKVAPDSPGRKCSICLDSMKNKEASTKCGHLFCFDCIKAAVKAQKKCPTCRLKLGVKDVHRVYL